jgi:ABC-type multidrug transport system ATPase subunit
MKLHGNGKKPRDPVSMFLTARARGAGRTQSRSPFGVQKIRGARIARLARDDASQLVDAAGAVREVDMVLSGTGAMQLDSEVLAGAPRHRQAESDDGVPVGPESRQSRVDVTAGSATPNRAPCSWLHVLLVSVTGEERLTLLRDLSFSARPGTLTAIIGPSVAAKTSLTRVVGGAVQPTAGSVTLERQDIHAGFNALRTRIGMVPEGDVERRQLTVEQVLSCARRRRLSPRTTKADRRHAGAGVLDELELTEHAATRIGILSGGQRKRASVATELLTGASLLILDEPATGLNPALGRQIMTMLRQLADAGRVVLVVTHSLTDLNMCDQVLLLAVRDKPAFRGPPDAIGPAMGTTDWADIFTKVSADPRAMNREFIAQDSAAATTDLPPPSLSPERAVQTGLIRQLPTLARRQTPQQNNPQIGSMEERSVVYIGWD